MLVSLSEVMSYALVSNNFKFLPIPSKISFRLREKNVSDWSVVTALNLQTIQTFLLSNYVSTARVEAIFLKRAGHCQQ